MECPYCGSELKYHDYYGKGNPFRSDFKKSGDIYQCQNSFGFNSEEEARIYEKENNLCCEDWMEIVCESYCHNGSFYTDTNDNLREGYPC